MTIEALGASEIRAILDAANGYRKELDLHPDFKTDELRGRTIVNLFFEASTRTRTSFEIAEKRLGADVVNLTPDASSLSKGETLLDTAHNLDAMGPSVVVVRHSSAGVPELLAGRIRACVVNAGDGSHEHPTQALLDALTIERHKGRLADLVVTIAGDIAHSRVARSNAHLLTKMGAKVRVAAPRTMLPTGIETLGVTAFSAIDEAVRDADVVMMLRIQRERMSQSLFPSLREFSRLLGLSAERLALAKPDALVMHPGPINRNVEMDSRVADGPQSVILDQVKNGVAVRMAVLARLAGRHAVA